MEVSERMSFCGKQKQVLIFRLLRLEYHHEISPHMSNLQVLRAKLVAVHVNG